MSKLHETNTNFKLAPGVSETVRATLKPSLYLSKTRNNNNSIKFFALGGVKNPTGGVLQSFAFNDSVEIEKPKLKLEVCAVLECMQHQSWCWVVSIAILRKSLWTHATLSLITYSEPWACMNTEQLSEQLLLSELSIVWIKCFCLLNSWIDNASQYRTTLLH